MGETQPQGTIEVPLSLRVAGGRSLASLTSLAADTSWPGARTRGPAAEEVTAGTGVAGTGRDDRVSPCTPTELTSGRPERGTMCLGAPGPRKQTEGSLGDPAGGTGAQSAVPGVLRAQQVLGRLPECSSLSPEPGQAGVGMGCKKMHRRDKKPHDKVLFLFFLDFIYLFMRDTEREREAETQAEGEAGSMQGARCRTRSWVSRITPWAEGSAKLLSHPGCPKYLNF